MNKIKQIAKNLVKLNIKEINKLYDILEKKYNIKFDVYSNTNNIENKSNINSVSDNKNIKDDNEEKTKNVIYDVYLKELGTVKLPVIKLINSITGKSLTDSKKAIDILPSLIKKSIGFDEAKKLQEDFKKVDAIIELKESNNE